MPEKENNLTIKDINHLLKNKALCVKLLALAESNQAKIYSEVTCLAKDQKHPVLRPCEGGNNTWEFKGITFQICECTKCGCSLSVPIEPHQFDQLTK